MVVEFDEADRSYSGLVNVKSKLLQAGQKQEPVKQERVIFDRFADDKARQIQEDSYMFDQPVVNFDKMAAFNRINQQLNTGPNHATSVAIDNTVSERYSFDPQGYDPVYRSRKTVEKRMSRNQSRELYKEQKSWNDADTNSLSPSVNTKPSIQLTARDNKNAAIRRQEALRQQNTSLPRSAVASRSIVEGSGDVGNIVLFFRIIAGYYSNISMSIRRILLHAGTRVDHQRTLQQRRELIQNNNMLEEQYDTGQLDNEIRSADRCNLLQLFLIALVIILFLMVVFKNKPETK